MALHALGLFQQDRVIEHRPVRRDTHEHWDANSFSSNARREVHSAIPDAQSQYQPERLPISPRRATRSEFRDFRSGHREIR